MINNMIITLKVKDKESVDKVIDETIFLCNKLKENLAYLEGIQITSEAIGGEK